MFNTPFAMPDYTQNSNGRYMYPGSNVEYVDHATELANKNGGNWNTPNVQGMLTRDTQAFGNGQIMYGMNTGFNGLADQMSQGFNDTADQMQYGGVYGTSQNRTYSPQSQNWGGNPFMVGSF
jgi:hypothetical protein